MAKQVISTKTQAIEKANSTLFITVIVASVIISFSLVFVQILWKQGRFNANVISAQEVARDDLESNLEAIPKLEAELVVLENADDILAGQGNKQNSAVILDALPSKYDFPAIATSFDALAKRTGVRLASFSGDDLGDLAEQSSPEPTPVEIPVTLSIEGDYDNIIRFLSTLEASIRPLVVSSLEITGNATGLTADVGLSTYYQPAVDLNVKKRTIE